MNELALFAGAGGGLLATKWLLGWKTVCYVEHASYPVKIIKARIRDGLLDDAPIWDDAFTFDGRPWAGLVDVVTAGFPCQPFSLAGKRLGENDPRNGWPATIRIIREVRPRYALLENVAALATHEYIRTIYGELAEAGLDAGWGVLSAAAIGAPHLRKRLWIVAHTKGERWGTWRTEPKGQQWKHRAGGNCGDGPYTNSERPSGAVQPISRIGSRKTSEPGSDGKVSTLAHAQGQRCGEEGQHFQRSSEWTTGCSTTLAHAEVEGLAQRGSGFREDKGKNRETKEPGSDRLARCDLPGRKWRITYWDVEPGVGRVVDGMAHRVDRIAACGNGQVPGVVAAAWNILEGRIVKQ